MGSYHIRDLESLSGIKAHTIRIWEQRYGLFRPQRTQTNIRRYSDSDLKHLLNIALLNQRGHRISRLAGLSRAELEEEIRQLISSDFSSTAQVHALTRAMVDMDEAEFDRLLNVNIAQLGFEPAMENTVFPFLDSIGVMWLSGTINVAQEHMISNLIRQKIIVAIDRVRSHIGAHRDRVLLFLPEEELHELGLLYLDYKLRSRQFQTLYLGQNVPLADLKEAVDVFRPAFGFSILTSRPTERRLQHYLNQLAEVFASARLYLGGYKLMRARQIELAENQRIFRSREELKHLLNQLFAT
ncbi:MAG: MerR family transcriptional regulator [Chitinophagales bacterium]|nr:MerR family transcriptional regulator [Chitinophagales bacterium]MDW8392785.1 MerR family transcriptional regulator [Chitinophagales bacterium]